ncbi:MAG: hypothetical protein ACLQVY_05835 [Limisphaerales bacterium]
MVAAFATAVFGQSGDIAPKLAPLDLSCPACKMILLDPVVDGRFAWRG